jgi:hypothetical protein
MADEEVSVLTYQERGPPGGGGIGVVVFERHLRHGSRNGFEDLSGPRIRKAS